MEKLTVVRSHPQSYINLAKSQNIFEMVLRLVQILG